MSDRDALLLPPPYALPRAEKAAFLERELTALTALHRERCPAYDRILGRVQLAPSQGSSAGSPLERIPFLPVSLFKAVELASVPPHAVIKVLTSSGTSGQVPSRIPLDQETATLQAKALAAIVQAETGPTRLPMVYVDHPGVVKNRAEFSARGAALLGFATFGREHVYVLDAAMKPDWERLAAVEARHGGDGVLFFGFTFMVWRHFVEEARRAGRRFSFAQGLLLHGGGWKKLEQEKVGAAEFREALEESFGIKRVLNYYGMVEQAGSIFVECSEGHLHTPAFADVIVRDPRDLAPLPPGHEGLLETLSVIPRSYPGHALLTEDMGVLLGEDDCPSGKLGRYFRVVGRAPQAELRGCSDTHAASWGAQHG